MNRVKEILNELTREELTRLILCYDRYVVSKLDEEEGTPVCLEEFYDNEFQEYAFDENYEIIE